MKLFVLFYILLIKSLLATNSANTIDELYTAVSVHEDISSCEKCNTMLENSLRDEEDNKFDAEQLCNSYNSHVKCLKKTPICTKDKMDKRRLQFQTDLCSYDCQNELEKCEHLSWENDCELWICIQEGLMICTALVSPVYYSFKSHTDKCDSQMRVGKRKLKIWEMKNCMKELLGNTDKLFLLVGEIAEMMKNFTNGISSDMSKNVNKVLDRIFYIIDKVDSKILVTCGQEFSEKRPLNETRFLYINHYSKAMDTYLGSLDKEQMEERRYIQKNLDFITVKMYKNYLSAIMKTRDGRATKTLLKTLAPQIKKMVTKVLPYILENPKDINFLKIFSKVPEVFEMLREIKDSYFSSFKLSNFIDQRVKSKLKEFHMEWKSLKDEL